MKKKILTFLIINIISLLTTRSARASSVSFEYNKINEKFVEVYVNLETLEEINAGDVNLVFNKDLVNVQSISIKNSIFNLWMRYTKYSNKDGKINFVAGRINSFQGKGNLIKIKFKVIGNLKENNFIELGKAYIAEANGIGNNTIN